MKDKIFKYCQRLYLKYMIMIHREYGEIGCVICN